MIALATEVTIWLLVSSALGLIAGFALARAFAKPTAAEPPRVITDDEEIKALIEELRQDQASKDDEMDSLRAQLEDLRRAPEPSEEATSATEEVLETLREQVDRLRTERDDRAREIQSFKEQNTSLQRRLDETADRLVAFERQRMQSHTPSAEPDPAPPTPAPGPKVPRDPAVARERERQIQDQDQNQSLELDVEKSSPLQVGQETEAPTEALHKQVEVEPAVATSVEEPKGDADPGHEKSIEEIEGIPHDVTERFALVGAKTNLQLLKKAGARTRRNGLATSMRLDPDQLLQYVHRADLMRVGMRDADVTSLYDAGVRSLHALGAAKADALTNRLESVSKRGSGRDTAPDHATVERWIHRAAALPALVEE